MNELEYRTELNDLINRAAKSLQAGTVLMPLLEGAGSIVFIASEISEKETLEGALEIARHHLDQSVARAKAMAYND